MRLILLLFSVSIAELIQYINGSNIQSSVTPDGNVTVSNELINITFDVNASVISLIKDGVDLVGTVTARTFYFDWNAGGGKFSPTNFSVITNTSDVLHIMYHQPFTTNHLDIEYHLQFHNNMSGFYQWLDAKHNGNLPITWSEFRMIFRFSVSLITSMSNMVREGEVPNLHNRPTIQDTTWQMADGSYWSKYDYVGYLRETPWFGMYGGGFGAWVVSPSLEYHTGGPLKQDLLTQHNTLMCHYLTSSHFGTGAFTPEYGWSKFYGPWLFYVNTGTDDEIIADVAKKTEEEVEQWPYHWLDSPNYPLDRGIVTGKILGQLKAQVVLHDSAEEYFELQTKGYLYCNKTSDNGEFYITNVRPGNYVLSIYPLAGQGSDNFITKNVTVYKDTLILDPIELPEPDGILWSIGETNRRADGFRYSEELRNFYWHLLPPENLTFYIGSSNSSKDWYYAQSKNGTWKVVFEDTPDRNSRTLRISIAGASGVLMLGIDAAGLLVNVNGANLTQVEYDNDKTIYRGALQSGKYHNEILTIPADLVIEGNNTVSFTVLYGGIMYDSISYQRNN